MDTYIVLKDWKSDYPDPIILGLGQQILVDKSEAVDDADWEGWVWGISADNSGWIPVQILKITENIDSRFSKAIVLEEYSAKELDVVINKRVVGSRTLNGWLWCHIEGEALWGWVPLRNLKKC